jgi:hypothetical protein
LPVGRAWRSARKQIPSGQLGTHDDRRLSTEANISILFAGYFAAEGRPFVAAGPSIII